MIDYSDAAAKSALILWIADIIFSFVFSPARSLPHGVVIVEGDIEDWYKVTTFFYNCGIFVQESLF